jgi:hypothetical protein
MTCLCVCAYTCVYTCIYIYIYIYIFTHAHHTSVQGCSASKAPFVFHTSSSSSSCYFSLTMTIMTHYHAMRLNYAAHVYVCNAMRLNYAAHVCVCVCVCSTSCVYTSQSHTAKTPDCHSSPHSSVPLEMHFTLHASGFRLQAQNGLIWHTCTQHTPFRAHAIFIQPTKESPPDSTKDRMQHLTLTLCLYSSSQRTATWFGSLQRNALTSCLRLCVSFPSMRLHSRLEFTAAWRFILHAHAMSLLIQPKNRHLSRQLTKKYPDLRGAWLLLFLCLALIRGQGDRLT